METYPTSACLSCPTCRCTYELNLSLKKGDKKKVLVVHCRDVGFDCEGIVQAETEEDLLQQVAEHAKSTHGLEEVTGEVVEKVKSVIREEE